MAHSVVKSKIDKSKLQFLDQLKYLLGDDAVDPSVIDGKYDKLMESVKAYYSVIIMLLESVYMKSINEQHISTAVQCKKYLKSLEGYRLQTIPIKDMSSIKYDKDKLSSTYTELCEQKFVRKIISKLDLMRIHKDKINQLDGSMFEDHVDSTYNPLHFGEINLKFAYEHVNVTGTARKLIMVVLQHMYKHSEIVYDVLTSPNIPEEFFFNMIDEIIDSVKGELRDVDEAINCLKSSKDVLRKDFKTYYLNFKVTDNPAVFLDSYINGIKESKNIKDSDKISLQFKAITKHYRTKLLKSGISGFKELDDLRDVISATDNIADIYLNQKDGANDDSD